MHWLTKLANIAMLVNSYTCIHTPHAKSQMPQSSMPALVLTCKIFDAIELCYAMSQYAFDSVHVAALLCLSQYSML